MSTASEINHRQVLLVDDDRITLWAIGRVLTTTGFTVTTAQDGEEAIQLLKKRGFDLLITDIHMPQVNGLKVLDWLHGHRPETPAMVITSNTSPAVQECSLQGGAILFLHKPVDPQQIVNRFHHYDQIVHKISLDPSSARELFWTLVKSMSLDISGTVIVRSQQKMGSIFFLAEKITWAAVSGEQGALRRHLLKACSLNVADIEAVYKECSAKGTNIYETLIQWGLVDSTRMRRAHQEWIVKNLYDIFRWSQIHALFVPQQWAYGSGLCYDIEEILSSICTYKEPLGITMANRPAEMEGRAGEKSKG